MSSLTASLTNGFTNSSSDKASWKQVALLQASFIKQKYKEID